MARATRASASSALIVHSEKGFDSRKLDEGRIAHPPFGMPLPLRVQLWPAQNCSVQSRLLVAEPLPRYRDLGFCFLGSQAVLGRERWWRRDRSGGCPQTGRDRHGPAVCLPRGHEAAGWASRYGFSALVDDLPDDSMHTVLDLSEYGIGPLGGPMKLDWNFYPKPKVSAADRKTAVETLRDN